MANDAKAGIVLIYQESASRHPLQSAPKKSVQNRGFSGAPCVSLKFLTITPDPLVYTLLQKKGNLKNVAFLMEKSVDNDLYFSSPASGISLVFQFMNKKS